MQRMTTMILAASMLVLAGCSSTADLIAPRFRVRLPAGQMKGSPSGVVNLNLLIDIFNDSSEEIVLKRIQIRSHGLSNLSILSESRIIEERIPAHDVRTIDIWVEANYRDEATGEQSMVRGTAIFKSEFGSFRRVFLEPILEHGRDKIGEDGP